MPGEPVMFIKLPNVKREMKRCVECAGEAPPELPAWVPKHHTTKRMTPTKKIAPTVRREWLPHPDD